MLVDSQKKAAEAMSMVKSRHICLMNWSVSLHKRPLIKGQRHPLKGSLPKRWENIRDKPDLGTILSPLEGEDGFSMVLVTCICLPARPLGMGTTYEKLKDFLIRGPLGYQGQGILHGDIFEEG